MAHRYNLEASRYGQVPVAVDAFDTLKLQLFPYPERGELVARIDSTNVTLPREDVRLQLLTGDEVETVSLQEGEDRLDVVLQAPESDAAQVQCTAVLLQGDQEISRTVDTTPWADPPVAVPDIATYRAPHLPVPVVTPAYQYRLDDSGSIRIDIEGEHYQLTSRFSYPQGGFNAFGPSEPGEWTLRRDGDNVMIGAGAHFTIRRKLHRTPTRIDVVDTITNTSTVEVGIMQEHHLAAPNKAVPTLNPNPTVFMAGPKHGVGVVALDDVFFLRAENRIVDGRAVLADRHLALPPGGTHTVRWALYPTATTDYFDFINQVRADEGINGHVPGGFGFTSSWEVPSTDYVQNRNLAFYSWASLTRVLQNPVNSLEGWEFTDYPELCDKIRTWIGATRVAHPDLQTTFHVAHSLFANNTPETLFPDSIARDVAGNLICYGGNNTDYYSRYFAPELVDAGWRWWIYYPTMENTFGKRMLESADYMIENLGATSVWADGYISGYVPGEFTYDHWDGVSATVDPTTHTITAKKALVPYVALPVLKAVARKYTDAGGYLVTNGKSGPFSFTRLPVISSCETSGGDQQPIAQLHLGSTVTPLGAPSGIKNFQDVYDDILGKLDHGALYFWHGERDTITEPTIVSEMYPFTFESIHPGTVRGKERIVTKVSSVYGWPGDYHLHEVHFYDGRGRKRPHRFVTTVDEQGVRTEVTLGEGESAVIERLPVKLEAEASQNVRVVDYDGNRLRIATSLSPGNVQVVALSDPNAGATLKLGGDGVLSALE